MKSYTMSFCLVCLSLSTLSLTACQPNTSDRGASNGVSGGAGGSGPNGATVSLMNEGQDTTADFLRTYVGQFADAQSGETISFGADRSYSTTLNRQVGSQSDASLPYPTVCSYKMSGELTVAVSRSVAARYKYLFYADTVIQTKIKHIELLPATGQSAHCDTFVAQQQKAIDGAGGSIPDTTYAELINSDQFRLHTSGGGDYVDGGPRTPSTLDEVHTRVASTPAGGPK